MSGSGATTLGSSCSGSVDDGDFKYLDGRIFNNNGNLAYTAGTHYVSSQNNAEFNNLPGGIFDIQSDTYVIFS